MIETTLLHHELETVTREDLVALFNEDLAGEYQAIISCVIYSQVIKGAQFMALPECNVALSGLGSQDKKGHRRCSDCSARPAPRGSRPTGRKAFNESSGRRSPCTQQP